MLTVEQYRANLASAKNVVRYNLGLDQIAPSDWTYSQRTAYNKALADLIAKYPDRFSAQEQQVAEVVNAKAYEPLDTSGVLDDLQTFGGALVDEAAALNADINPFSAQNRQFLFWLAVAGVGLYFLAPSIATLIRAKKGGK